MTNFRKYIRFTTIVETIKFDWNNQTNQYNSHLELFLDLQLWLCIFIFQIYLNGAKIWISTQKMAVILPGIFHKQKKFPRPWVARSRLVSCLSLPNTLYMIYLSDLPTRHTTWPTDKGQVFFCLKYFSFPLFVTTSVPPTYSYSEKFNDLI